MRPTSAFVAACLICAGAAGGARQATLFSEATQQPAAQAPVFKSNVVIARLDLEAFDKNGKPVTDLTESDFSVFENGVRQEVRAFSREQLKPEAPSPDATPALVRGLPLDPVAPRTRRIFLIVLGYGRLQGPVKAFDGAASFIRERLLPQDLVSVMAFNRATDLTTNHEQAADVVERLKIRHEHLVFELTEFSLDRSHRSDDIPVAIQADIDAAFQPPSAPDSHVRSATNMIIDTDVSTNMIVDRDVFRRTDNGPGNGPRPWNKMVATSDLLKIYAGIEYLRHLDGEKHLICMTLGEGSLALDDARLAARANDARVVLDIVHTAGVPGFSGGADGSGPLVPPSLESLDSIGSSEEIARLTGGQFTGVSYADAALGRIDQATRFGYVIGYAPSNLTLDGKYRNVTVTVNRPGVRTLFRHGYTAQTDAAPLDLRGIVTRSRLKAAETTDIERRDIALQAKVSAAPSGDPAGQIRVELTIDASRLSFTQVGERHVATIDLDIFCGDARQKVVGSLKQKMEMSLEEDRYKRALKDGITYTVTVPVTAKPAHVRVFAYDYGADLLGTATVTVK